METGSRNNNFRIDPPLELATHIRNETTCLFELINPFPSKNLNKDTGLSAFCDEVGFFRLTKTFSIYFIE